MNRCTEHSPTPWRVSDEINGGGGYWIEHSGGYLIGDIFYKADAAHIVEAVNGQVNLLNALSEEQEHGYLLEEERDRLRDIVRRLTDALDTITYLEDHEIDRRREAREALGEEQP